MIVHVKSPKEIEVIPESELDDSILRDGTWMAETINPKPLEINKLKLVLKKQVKE